MRKIALVVALFGCLALFVSAVPAQRRALPGTTVLDDPSSLVESTSSTGNDRSMEIAFGSLNCFVSEFQAEASLDLKGTSGFVNGTTTVHIVAPMNTDCQKLATDLASLAEQFRCATSPITAGGPPPMGPGLFTFECHGDRNRVMIAVGAISAAFLTSSASDGEPIPAAGGQR